MAKNWYTIRDMKKYIYILYDPRNIFNIRYVGQAKDVKKRYEKHISPSGLKGNNYKTRWIKKILSEGIKPEILVIDDCKLEEADDLETFWISTFKKEGHRLTNTNWRGNHSNDGGCLSWEARQKISLSLKGHEVSLETRKILSEKNKGKILSEETRKKMSDFRKGKPFSGTRMEGPLSEESRLKISNANKGRKPPPLTDEGRKKISESSKKFRHTEESKKKISEANSGNIISETQKASIKEFMKGRAHNKGNNHSVETKKILSEKLSGDKHPQFGKPRSEETKRKIRETRLRKKELIREHNNQKK